MNTKQEVDIWTAYFETKKREYVAQGMSEEDADERASREVRDEIRRFVPAPR